VQIAVVRPQELGKTELDTWRDFQRATQAFEQPFLAPEFSVVVGRHRPQAHVAVLTDGPDVVGFFPFERGRLGIGAPIAANLTGCQGLVHAPGVVWEPDQLLRACRLSVWEFDCLVDGQAPFRPHERIRAPAPIMDLSQGWDGYARENRLRSRSSMKRLEEKIRKLGREVGQLRLRHDVRDGADLHSLMAWKSEQYRRTGRSDRFSWQGVPEIVEELLETRTETFSGVLSSLYAGDHLVAATFTLCSHRTAAGWLVGYNPEFARYSVGIKAQLVVAEALAVDGIRELHMGRGTRDAYKQTLKSRDLVVSEGRVMRRTPGAALHWARAAPARRIRYLVTESPRLLRAADRTLYRFGAIRTSVSRRAGLRSTEPARDGASR
jgi:CelD/BcsL family acetyltransferase involved in cellulose biosynthesis